MSHQVDIGRLRLALCALGASEEADLVPLAHDVAEALRIAGKTKRAAKVGRPRDPRRLALTAVAQLAYMRLMRQPPSVNCWPTADGDTTPRGPYAVFVGHIFAAAGLRASSADIRR
jgi:hypothetical protein